MSILDELEAVLEGFETDCQRIHAEMEQAERIGRRFGLPVPWAPAVSEERRKKGGYARHDDATELVTLAVNRVASTTGGAGFGVERVAGVVNGGLIADGRPPMTEAAVSRQLGTLVERGHLERCDEGQGRRWRRPRVNVHGRR
jgi:hypothetical protein